ncbi:hemolysin III family protein, partial [Mixta mediterraneensis]|uniref:hemolysin III family protein n=1 Tax=Mixta mediterraneensis TaxID=2758443 RepID=UPI003AFF9284
MHGSSFLCMLVTAIVFIVLSFAYRFNSSVLVYILSQLLQFGVSSVYHIPLWSPRIKRILQHVDHICIFILISGTQTSVLLTNILTRSNPLTHLALKVSWSISIVGIMKILF